MYKQGKGSNKKNKT